LKANQKKPLGGGCKILSDYLKTLGVDEKEVLNL
jgi:hypothetical protein